MEGSGLEKLLRRSSGEILTRYFLDTKQGCQQLTRDFKALQFVLTNSLIISYSTCLNSACIHLLFCCARQMGKMTDNMT
jgi:hypothetical protein